MEGQKPIQITDKPDPKNPIVFLDISVGNTVNTILIFNWKTSSIFIIEIKFRLLSDIT